MTCTPLCRDLALTCRNSSIVDTLPQTVSVALRTHTRVLFRLYVSSHLTGRIIFSPRAGRFLTALALSPILRAAHRAGQPASH
jgi:hypothetical protein